MPALHTVAAAAPPRPAPPLDARAIVDRLPPGIAATVWRGSELGSAAVRLVPTGWDALDRELPGGGWPAHGLVEILAAQPAVLEWRLLGPALSRVVAGGGQVVVVGPPRHPHPPGLLHEGLDPRHLVWVRAETPAEQLWATEQLVQSGAAGAVVAWLPQARPDQVRRLQLRAQACPGLVFLCRPEAARHASSAAPLRLLARHGLDWEIGVRVLKRRGPAHEGFLSLPSVPGGLADVLTPRLQRPSAWLRAAPTALADPARREAHGAAPAASPIPLPDPDHALGRPASRHAERRATHH
ncbi:MAG: translesion DNA synthesis-associated protein ImuA [Xylophilus ampelinus]